MAHRTVDKLQIALDRLGPDPPDRLGLNRAVYDGVRPGFEIQLIRRIDKLFRFFTAEIMFQLSADIGTQR